MTGPTAEDVIAEALRPVVEHRRDYGLASEDADHFAAAVVAAIRGMTVEQQAELIGGFVAVKMAGGAAVIAVGPWRAEP